MNWRVNAYCPEGHLNTLTIDFPDDVAAGPTSMAFWAPEGCETCKELANVQPILSGWKERRRAKQEVRRFRRQLKNLG